MGKILGISNLPVSTIDKAIIGYHFEPIKRYPIKLSKKIPSDKFISKNLSQDTSMKTKIKNYFNKRIFKNKLDNKN